MKLNMKTPLLTLVLALGLSACASSPAPRDKINPPPTWTAEQPEASAECDAFGCFGIDDPLLAELLAEALAYNHDLGAAAARVRQATINARIAGAERWPFLDLSAQASRQRQPLTGTTALGVTPDQGDGETTEAIRTSQYSVNLNLSWELDLWGRIAAQDQAAGADYLAQLNQYRSAQFSLTAQSARAWFAAIEARLQLELAEETLDNYQASARVAIDRTEAGVQPPSDAALSRSNVAQARAIYQQRRQAMHRARQQLELLLGRYPAAEIAIATALPDISQAPAARLPAETLQRRPDLAAASAAILGAQYRTQAARAALFPRITLTGSAGKVSEDLSDLLEGPTAWSLSAGLLQPIFQAGRLRNQVELNRAITDEAVASYRALALQAFSEVEAALLDEEILQLREAALAETVDAARTALRVSTNRYQAGVDPLLLVLESQRRLFDSQSALLAASRARLDNRANLYLALGGGPITADESSTPEAPDRNTAPYLNPLAENDSHRATENTRNITEPVE